MTFENYEKLANYFFEYFGTVPTGCRYCQPNGSDSNDWIRVVTNEPIPCPGCGKVLTEFYAPKPEGE